MTWRLLWIPFSVVFLLAACGGDDDAGSGGTEPVPPQLALLASGGARLQWVEGTRYQLTLMAPHGTVGVFGGAPLRRVVDQPLRAWVDGWVSNGPGTTPPTAALSTAGGAEPAAAIFELSAPVLSGAGALQFDARITDAGGRVSAWFPVADFTGVQLLVEQATRAAPPDRGLLALAAAAGTLTAAGDGRYVLTIGTPSALTGLTRAPLQRALSEPAAAWVREWSARGFDGDPPAAALTFATAPGAPADQRAVVELGTPTLRSDGGLDLDVRLLSRPAGGALPRGAAHDVQLVVADAPLLAGSGCRSATDCGGSASCSAERTCVARACTGDADCATEEMCDVGHCVRVATCTVADGATACSDAQACDGERCRLKACATTADCDGAESCRAGVCTAGQLGATAQAAATARDAFWGASWTAPKLASVCERSQQPSDAAVALCQQFETAAEDRVRNLVAMLAQGDASWSYYGKYAFSGVNETAPIPPAFQAQYAIPSAAMEASLIGHFSIFDTAYINYSTRLGTPLVGAEVLSPFAAPLPASPSAFVEPFYASLRDDTPDGFPGSFISSFDPLILAKQFGGGGGFGCYLGTIDASTQVLAPPAIQFGAGFGFGISESSGLDLGFGGGINLCTAASISACVEDPVNFFGGGGGVNFDYASSTETPDEDTDGDPTAFNSALQGELAESLRNAEQLYLSCGHGGGTGFQSLPANQGPTVPPVYQQTFGVGGGGWSFAVLTRSAAGADVSDVNLLTALDSAAFSALYGQFVDLLDRDAGAPPAGNPAFGQRGLYDTTGSKRYAGSLQSVGFVYEPYQFPVTDPAQASADTVYIPGSNSPAGLFFSSGGTAQVAADVARMSGDGIGGLLYTINVNAQDVEYGTATAQVRDINDTVLAALAAAAIPVTLAVPLAIQHDADGVSQQAPIVSSNQEILDYAVAALSAYANVERIVVGTAEHGVIKGFFPSCNGFNYTTAIGCDDYTNALTFEDYYFLLQYLVDRIGTPQRPITLGVLQSQENWFANSTISNSSSDPVELQLIGYWSLPSSTPGTGLKHFITDLQAPNITLEPMVAVDLVTEYSGQPLASALTGLQAVLNRIKQNVASAAVVTGWYGSDVAGFLASEVVAGMPALGFELLVDELTDQPWRALPSGPGGLPGMPGTICGHVYPIPGLDQQDPQGPPLMQDLPPQCGPDFTKIPPGGGQPQPPCLCLTNSTDYPATFMPFLSDLTPSDESPPTLVVPARRAVTYDKSAPDGFFNAAVNGKDGAYSLGVTWRQWPYSETWANPPSGPQAGDPVPTPQPRQALPSLVCVGVSDAQNGAANANAGSPCDQVWYQTIAPSPAAVGAPTPVIETDCVTLQWQAKGTGYAAVTGWEVQTLEAPPPNPGETPLTYNQAPLVVVPQQDQQLDDPDQEVSSQYTYCGNDAFPNGLTPGLYQFRVQPIGGIPSVDAIDVEFPLITVTSGATDWQTLGTFSVDYPLDPDGLSSPIGSLVFTLPPPLAQCGQPSSKSFTLTAPVDSGISDISLPGQPPGNNAGGDDTCYTTTLTVNFTRPVPVSSGPPITTCSVALVITAGMDAGDQDGEAVRAAGPIEPDKPEQACFLELQNDLKTVNGSSFQFTLPSAPERAHSGLGRRHTL